MVELDVVELDELEELDELVDVGDQVEVLLSLVGVGDHVDDDEEGEAPLPKSQEPKISPESVDASWEKRPSVRSRPP